tara:strand:+ start:73 stop:801 length:729 start_codon:yes stop_codon:yes gene_type:complete
MRNNLSLKRQLKEKIFLLKDNFPSWSIRDISKQVGCSKSTTHYHLTEGSVDKIRTKLCKKTFKKLHRFCYDLSKPKKEKNKKETRLLRKAFRSYVYGRNRKNRYQEGKMELKHKPKIFQLLDKIWPGMVKENDSFQAVSQWTGKPDFYDDGTPIMTPYVRCKLTNEVIDVKNGSTHADHVDGDRTNNSIENFSAVVGWSNQMKTESPGYYEMADRMITILNNIRKHNKDIDELINNKLKENN